MSCAVQRKEALCPGDVGTSFLRVQETHSPHAVLPVPRPLTGGGGVSSLGSSALRGQGPWIEDVSVMGTGRDVISSRSEHVAL